MPAYFFRDPDGQIPVTATLYHEVSHQLLFETAGPNAYTKNVGNYWVFEGLGTYFETVSPQPDGSLEVGGLVGRRIEEAIKSLVDQGRSIPLAEFVALDENAFNSEDRDLSPLPAGHGLDRLSHAVARGDLPRRIPRLRSGRLPRADQARHGRSLQDRLGQTYSTLDGQFLAFLKNGEDRCAAARRPRPAEPRASHPDRTQAMNARQLRPITRLAQWRLIGDATVTAVSARRRRSITHRRTAAAP